MISGKEKRHWSWLNPLFQRRHGKILIRPFFCLIFCFFTRKNNLILSAVANAKSCHFHQNFRFAHQKQAVHFLLAFLNNIFTHRGHIFNFEMNFSLNETFGWESFCWNSIFVDEWNQIEIYFGLVEIFRLLSFLKLLNWSKDVALIWPLSERLLKEREREIDR